jgi:hypothetical protein
LATHDKIGSMWSGSKTQEHIVELLPNWPELMIEVIRTNLTRERSRIRKRLMWLPSRTRQWHVHCVCAPIDASRSRFITT